MALNLFKKEDPAQSNPATEILGRLKHAPPSDRQKRGQTLSGASKKEELPALPTTGNAEAYRVLKNFYISEKASLLNGFNQYVFKVFRSTNKSQIKKQVEKLFNVKVISVKVLNMPRKRRDLGRHPGFRSEFKKAIVVLEKGQTIEQAR